MRWQLSSTTRGGDLYSRQAISNRLKDLDVIRKKASTEGYQTQRPDVELSLWSFWNCPPPAGVLRVPRWKLIDFDKFGVSLEKCNRTGGWAVKVLCVHKDGHYHHGAKIIVIFAIEPGDPRLQPHVQGLWISVGIDSSNDLLSSIYVI
jgi:hypothetical protein